MSDALTPGATASAEIKTPGQACDPVTILYTNWRGETAVRRIVPGSPDPALVSQWFGSSEWHPEPQWLFSAYDLDKGAYRDFARSGVKAWGQEAVDAALAPPAVPEEVRDAEQWLQRLFDTEPNALMQRRMRVALDALRRAAQPAGRVDEGGETARLREEAGYWRRDLSARLWFATGLYEAALRAGRLDEATTYAQVIRSGLAAFKSVDAGEFHSRCEACGEFVLPGEQQAGNEDISGHARCLCEGAQDEPRGPDDTETDLRVRVVAAEAALALPWPEDEEGEVAPAPAPDSGRGTAEGWRMVPVEPTDGMQQDGLAALEAAIRKHGKPSLPGFAAAHVYRAMLDAAPTPPVGKDEGHLAGIIAAKSAEIAPIFLDMERRKLGPCIYMASKTAHAPRWRQLRSDGVPIISTWIDEAGKGETACFTDLWRRCVKEASEADAVIVYREPNEVLKGAFVEVGAALAVGVPVYAVGCDEFSFIHHADVTRCETLQDALDRAAPPAGEA